VKGVFTGGNMLLQIPDDENAVFLLVKSNHIG